MSVHTGTENATVDWTVVHDELANLANRVGALGLPQHERVALQRELVEARSERNPRRLAVRLGAVARVLSHAGALSSVVDGLRSAATALGPAGRALHGTLGAAL